MSNGLKPLRMETPRTGQQWLDEHFYLPRGSSQRPGRWTTQPSQVVPVNVIANDAIHEICVQKPSRNGFSKILVGMNMCFAVHRKRSGAYYGPTDPYVKGIVNKEVNPVFPVMPAVQAVFPEWNKKGNSKNTDIYKDYGGAQWDYLGAATSNHLMALTKQVIFVDEYTRIKQDPGNEGSLRTLFKRRLTGAPFPTLVVGSSPGIQGEDDLEVMMEEMDVRLQMNLPCPFCHEEQTLKWGGPEYDFGIYFDKEGSKDERAASTRYECEHCREHIEYKQLKAMELKGRWICDRTGIWTEDGYKFYNDKGQSTKTPRKVGLWINALYSLNLTEGWSELVREWLDIQGDPLALKAFTNTIFAEYWIEPNKHKLDWEILYNRREVWVGQVPREAVYITAGVDTQDDRIEAYIYAWGAYEECWLIDSWASLGNLVESKPWEQAIEWLNKTYQHALGFEMPISRVCWDTGGHFTSQVHAACRKGGIKKFLPIRGANTPDKPIANMPKKRNKKRGTYFFEVGTEDAKDTIYGRYRLNRKRSGEPSPGYIHLPADDGVCGEKACQEFVAEIKIAVYRKNRRVFTWDCPKGKRNEGTDCANYALAALRASKQRFGLNLERRSAKQLGTPMPKSKRSKQKKSGTYGGV